MRAPQIAWFLGAGASAAAGVPTAGQLVWDFKRQIYCAAERIPVAAYSNVLDPNVQERIQRFFDDTGGYPARWADDEYAFYFERAYPDEADRRSYIDQVVRTASPSFGHLALAGLLKADRARVVWTTNFDRALEDAAATILGSTSALVVATLSEPSIATQSLNSGRWPILGKLHGDFHSRRLKNTSRELQAQDAEMRHALLETCRRFGLAVVGYSGRDETVMETLHEALFDGRGYPAGLYWFHRSSSRPLSTVMELVTKAKAIGINAHLIEVETFDELLADVTRMIPDLPTDVMERLDQRALRVSAAPLLQSSKQWPVVRLNALPIVTWPTICRRLTCTIGESSEIQASVMMSDSQVIAVRRRHEVLAFGRDSDVWRAFQRYSVKSWDVHAIEAARLQNESQEHGLLYDALGRAFARERPVNAQRTRHSHMLIIDSSQQTSKHLSKLKSATGTLTGTIPKSSLKWAEATHFRLECRLDRLWLLLEPTIWVEHTVDESENAAAQEFRRERLARRYNQASNAILEGWVHLIVGGKEEAELRAFGVGDGIDATFLVGKTTAFSRRGGRE